MNGKIYGIRNETNGKMYIGQTTLSLKQRFQRHTAVNKTNEKTAISKAIHSLGADKFEIFLIQENFESIDELNEAETKYIKAYNTLAPNGYNLCPGGQNWRRKPNLSPEHIPEIIKKYNDGASLRTLEKEYKTGKAVISRKLKEQGVQIRSRSHKLPDRTSKVTKEIMLDLYVNKRMKMKDIAKELQVDVYTVNYAKRRYGLSR